uniref:Uncharacterized protein n=1 Tax=Anguilla anguilla TaxID=7936 RepID=A0A0E9QE06_ANGAN
MLIHSFLGRFQRALLECEELITGFENLIYQFHPKINHMVYKLHGRLKKLP